MKNVTWVNLGHLGQSGSSCSGSSGCSVVFSVVGSSCSVVFSVVSCAKHMVYCDYEKCKERDTKITNNSEKLNKQMTQHCSVVVRWLFGGLFGGQLC